jgi:hypothetical protein
MSRHLWLAILLSLTVHALFVLFSARGFVPESRKLYATLREPTVSARKKTSLGDKANLQRSYHRNKPSEILPTEAIAPDADVVSEFPRNDFLDPAQVDEQAKAEDVPEFPAPPEQTGLAGHLLMKIFVNELGEPVLIDVEENTLPQDYSQLLVQRSYQAKFRPAQISGQPIKSWRHVEIRIAEENAPTEPNLTKSVR